MPDQIPDFQDPRYVHVEIMPIQGRLDIANISTTIYVIHLYTDEIREVNRGDAERIVRFARWPDEPVLESRCGWCWWSRTARLSEETIRGIERQRKRETYVVEGALEAYFDLLTSHESQLHRLLDSGEPDRQPEDEPGSKPLPLVLASIAGAGSGSTGMGSFFTSSTPSPMPLGSHAVPGLPPAAPNPLHTAYVDLLRSGQSYGMPAEMHMSQLKLLESGAITQEQFLANAARASRSQVAYSVNKTGCFLRTATVIGVGIVAFLSTTEVMKRSGWLKRAWRYDGSTWVRDDLPIQPGDCRSQQALNSAFDQNGNRLPCMGLDSQTGGVDQFDPDFHVRVSDLFRCDEVEDHPAPTQVPGFSIQEVIPGRQMASQYPITVLSVRDARVRMMIRDWDRSAFPPLNRTVHESSYESWWNTPLSAELCPDGEERPE